MSRPKAADLHAPTRGQAAQDPQDPPRWQDGSLPSVDRQTHPSVLPSASQQLFTLCSPRMQGASALMERCSCSSSSPTRPAQGTLPTATGPALHAQGATGGMGSPPQGPTGTHGHRRQAGGRHEGSMASGPGKSLPSWDLCLPFSVLQAGRADPSLPPRLVRLQDLPAVCLQIPCRNAQLSPHFRRTAFSWIVSVKLLHTGLPALWTPCPKKGRP